jgi:hypothetical protein
VRFAWNKEVLTYLGYNDSSLAHGFAPNFSNSAESDFRKGDVICPGGHW